MCWLSPVCVKYIASYMFLNALAIAARTLKKTVTATGSGSGAGLLRDRGSLCTVLPCTPFIVCNMHILFVKNK